MSLNLRGHAICGFNNLIVSKVPGRDYAKETVELLASRKGLLLEITPSGGVRELMSDKDKKYDESLFPGTEKHIIHLSAAVARNLSMQEIHSADTGIKNSNSPSLLLSRKDVVDATYLRTMRALGFDARYAFNGHYPVIQVSSSERTASIY